MDTWWKEDQTDLSRISREASGMRIEEEEREDDEVDTGSLPRTSTHCEWLGCFGKKPIVEWLSLDRPRSYPDSSQLPITQRRLSAIPLTHLYFTTSVSLRSFCVLPSKLHT